MTFSLEQIRADLPVGAVVKVYYNTGRTFDKDPIKVERRVYGVVVKPFPLTITHFDRSLDVPFDVRHTQIELEEILDYEVYEKP